MQREYHATNLGEDSAIGALGTKTGAARFTADSAEALLSFAGGFKVPADLYTGQSMHESESPNGQSRRNIHFRGSRGDRRGIHAGLGDSAVCDARRVKGQM
jgi:hypothetical protein